MALVPRWARLPLHLPWLPVTEHLVSRPLGGLATSAVRWVLQDVREQRERAREP